MGIFQTEALAVGAVAGLTVIVHAVAGIRERRCDTASALAHFVVALSALVLAFLILIRVVSPVVGYALLCLALTGHPLFDLLQDEHMRRRRVASLAPRPVAEVVPTIWIAIAAASVAMLAPYVILGEQRSAALIVGICAFVMAGIAWRFASAPIQLHGEDIRYERTRDRASRTRKAGLTAVIAMGSIMVFIMFVNSDLPVVLPLQRIFVGVSFFTWAASAVWVILYCRYLYRLSPAAS